MRLRKDPKRSESSRRWLQRQMKDPYVVRSKKEGYRSRAAYKLLELNEKYHFLKPSLTVLDLGAAPGGWTQIAVSLVKSTSQNPSVFAFDILPMEPLEGASIFEGDFMEDATLKNLEEEIGGKVDVVLSDMAPSTTGHAATDHLRIIGMVEAAYDFARNILKPGGAFIAKVFQGGTEKDLLLLLKQDFEKVHHAKPPASRKESSELYVIALGFGKRKLSSKEEEKRNEKM
ncbi:MAG: RlmE family RNA methyltransferase [Proteobacteria bacterium]|nr:RlmE family RNA methyltransferase [Pseudomonadota bacterium]